MVFTPTLTTHGFYSDTHHGRLQRIDVRMGNQENFKFTLTVAFKWIKNWVILLKK